MSALSPTSALQKFMDDATAEGLKVEVLADAVAISVTVTNEDTERSAIVTYRDLSIPTAGGWKHVTRFSHGTGYVTTTSSEVLRSLAAARRFMRMEVAR